MSPKKFTPDEIAAEIEDVRQHNSWLKSIGHMNGEARSCDSLIAIIEQYQHREEAWSSWITRVGNSHGWISALQSELPDVAAAVDWALSRDYHQIDEDSIEKCGLWYDPARNYAEES